MELIDKSAVVAEIERLYDEWKWYSSTEAKYRYECYTELLDFPDTLEVKEVELEKEIDNVWNPHFNLGWDDNSLVSINHKSFEAIAKHFFELGLKTQKE